MSLALGVSCPAWAQVPDKPQTESQPQPETFGVWKQTVFHTGFNFPRGIAADKDGNLYVADYGNNRVVKVAASGKSSNIAAQVNEPTGLAVDSNGDVITGIARPQHGYFGTYFVANTKPTVYKAPAVTDVNIYAISGMTFCGSYAGAGVVGTDPVLYASGEQFGGFEGIEFGDLEGITNPNLSSIPTGFATRGLACDAALNLYIVDGTFYQVWKRTPKGVMSRVGSGYNRPQGVAVDSSGNVFVADTGNNRIVEVSPAGVQTSFGTGLNSPIAVAVYEWGNGTREEIFVSDSGNNRIILFQ